MDETGRTKFVVFKANILDDEGVKRRDGDVVSLTPKTARHYNRLGFLRPFFDENEEDEDDDDDDGDDDTVGAAQTQLARSRRAPTVSKTA